MPRVGFVISLLGSLCTSTLALVLPPLLHMRVCRPPPRSFAYAADVAMCTLGVSVTVVGTASSLQQIVAELA